MENEKKIKILWVVLIISIFLNISSFYTIGHIDNQWENFYDENNVEWCVVVNQGNELVNLLLEELRYYDEGYDLIEDMEMITCFR